jgi:hypothetical protein
MNRKTTSADSNDIGIFAIFLFQGLTETQKSLLADQCGGQIGIANWIAEFAPIVTEFNASDEREYPGVFAYEIVESMGQWLGDNADATHTQFKAEISLRTSEWISSHSTSDGDSNE